MDTWLAVFGAVATIVGGAWTAFVYFDKKKQTSEKPRPTTEVNAPGGIASARDTVIHGNVTFTELPKGAMGLAALGLLVLAWALLNMGDRVTTYNVTNLNLSESSFGGLPADKSLLETAVLAYASTSDGQIASSPLSALEGTWSSQWRRYNENWHQGTASARQIGDGLVITYREAGGVWDLQARYVKPGVLFGPWRNRDDASDAGYWVGFVTPQGDISGYYERGEWHFSRQ